MSVLPARTDSLSDCHSNTPREERKRGRPDGRRGHVQIGIIHDTENRLMKGFNRHRRRCCHTANGTSSSSFPSLDVGRRLESTAVALATFFLRFVGGALFAGVTAFADSERAGSFAPPSTLPTPVATVQSPIQSFDGYSFGR